MSMQYYSDALRLGQKEYKTAVAAGEDPYLPALDVLVPNLNSLGGKEIGLVQVPMEFIVGTKTEGRTKAFARNFMPLLANGTEFASKWQSLCKSHLEEGIRDSVKLYEYMNRFYVQEGNKRVSVLRFFGAVSVPAEVIRVMPEDLESKAARQYLEYLEFNSFSRVSELEFTKPGSYREFQRLVGKAPKEPWSDEDRSRLSLILLYFREAYAACGGSRQHSTVGDALLAYIKVYGYHELYSLGKHDIRVRLQRVWEDIRLLQEEAPIDLKLSAPEERKPGIFAGLAPQKARRVAFVHHKTPELSGWTFGHEIGRIQSQRMLDGRIESRSYFCEDSEAQDEQIRQAISDGNSIVFTTSPVLLPGSLRAAVDHPEVTILNCSVGKSHRYIRTYYARMYEAKMIIGAIAGSLCGGDDVGYICDYPIFGQIAGINAFALGVAMTAPNAKVYLEWSGTGTVEDAVRHLTDRGISVISSQDIARLNSTERNSFGLYRVEADGQRTLLVRPVWNWSAYYETLLRRILDRSIKAEYDESSRALNYFWGLSEGVIDLKTFKKLPEGTIRLVDMLRQGIRSGVCEPMSGPIRAQDGSLKLAAGRTLSPEQIVNMDWLAENVIGSIPTYKELTETGRRTVDMMGVSPATEEANAEATSR